MKIIKVKLKKPGYDPDISRVSLYGYSENSTNDAPACDSNASVSNCHC